MHDLISRRVAIEKFEPWLKVKGYSEGELNMLKAVIYELAAMPSAQPDKEPTEEEVAAFCVRRNLVIITKEFYQMLTHGKYLPPPVVTPDIIYCRECKNHIDERCIQADHHTSDNDCCMSVFHAERRADDEG